MIKNYVGNSTVAYELVPVKVPALLPGRRNGNGGNGHDD
jgi:hypothetical protein